MMEMFLFETNQNLDELEAIVINSEKNNHFTAAEINDVFRIMHTIKGSAAMMVVNDVAHLAHAIEDIFYYLREKKPQVVNCSALTDIILAAADFIKTEIDKLAAGGLADASAKELIISTSNFLNELKKVNAAPDPAALAATDSAVKAAEKPQQYYVAAKPATGALNVFQAVIFYTDGCEMENVRAFSAVNALRDVVNELYSLPENILEDASSVEKIRAEGFQMWFTTTLSYAAVSAELNKNSFLREVQLKQLESVAQCSYWPSKAATAKTAEITETAVKPVANVNKAAAVQKNMISVNVDKLDLLMDLVGELVIAEAMVTQHPELHRLELSDFYKAARHLKKISGELQAGVMAIRMVPLGATFQKMSRLVRDLPKKLGKQVDLVLVGGDTEVDKNVIEHISDPLMHIIRNSIDHGIELPSDRQQAGKAAQGKIILSAKNVGSDVVIDIVDDGRGLARKKILARAKQNGLLEKSEAEYTDKEIYAFIFRPGFSTKEAVTEFSGRGVGLDVVVKNINAVRGSVSVDSQPGQGSTFTLKIPLTLAIITGMTVKVGPRNYTVPIMSIRESFRSLAQQIIVDPSGNELIMVRGQCYPILRLQEIYAVDAAITQMTDGIMIMVETEDMTVALFADSLLGQQQVVVKPLPDYIKQLASVVGIGGCTLLGDGSISLIIDVAELVTKLK